MSAPGHIQLFASVEPHAASPSPADIRHALEPMLSACRLRFGTKKICPDKFGGPGKTRFYLGKFRAVSDRDRSPPTRRVLKGDRCSEFFFALFIEAQLEHEHQRRAADAAKRRGAAKETPLDNPWAKPVGQWSRHVALLAVGCDHACRAQERRQVDGHLRISRWLTIEAHLRLHGGK
jgi:hypothetical protein